jgi:quinol monooxygenase YgiN
VIITTLTVAPAHGCREEMMKIFWLLLGPVRAEPGCQGCRLYEEVGNEDVLLYVEEWETREDLERHMRSARYERLLAIMEASARPPILRYDVVSCSQGLEYLEAVRLGSGVAKRCQDPFSAS